MAPPPEAAEPKATTLRLDADIREALDGYCAAERRTLNGAVNYLIMRGLDVEAREKLPVADPDPVAAEMKRELASMDPAEDLNAYYEKFSKLIERQTRR